MVVRRNCGNYSRCITMCSSFFFLSGPFHCVGRSSRSSNGMERTQKTRFPLQKLHCDLQTEARHKDRHLQLHLQEHHEGLITLSSHKAFLCQLELHFYSQLGHSSNPSELFLCFKKSLKHKQNLHLSQNIFVKHVRNHQGGLLPCSKEIASTSIYLSLLPHLINVL